MTQREQEIRDRLSAATPGEWVWDGKVWEYNHTEEAPWLLAGPDNKQIIWGEVNCHERDANLIAHAPADLAWLLGELASVQMLLEGYGSKYAEQRKRADGLESALATANAKIEAMREVVRAAEYVADCPTYCDPASKPAVATVSVLLEKWNGFRDAITCFSASEQVKP